MIKKLITLAAALGFVSIATVSSYADGADAHSGMYVGVTGSAFGIEVDGTETSKGGDNDNNTTATAGKFAFIGGGELGMSFALTDGFLVDLGFSMVPGAAKLSTNASDSTDNDATMNIENYRTLSICPTIAINDTAAMYLKVGYTEADVAVTGDITKPANLEGTTLAIGTRLQMASGMYVRTEAGYTDFDKITATGKGTTGGIASTTTFKADPTAAYGKVVVGYKF